MESYVVLHEKLRGDIKFKINIKNYKLLNLWEVRGVYAMDNKRNIKDVVSKMTLEELTVVAKDAVLCGWQKIIA